MSSSLADLLAVTGAALVAYSKTYSAWMQEKVQEHLFASEELAEALGARLKYQQDRLNESAELAKRAGGSAVFESKEADFRFASEVLEREYAQLSEIAEAQARLRVSVEKQKHYRHIAKFRKAESIGAFVLGIGMMLCAGWLMVTEGKPNQALLPTPTVVTPPAGQESSRP